MKTHIKVFFITKTGWDTRPVSEPRASANGPLYFFTSGGVRKYKDEQAGVFHGEVINTKDAITFQRTSVPELKQPFGCRVLEAKRRGKRDR